MAIIISPPSYHSSGERHDPIKIEKLESTKGNLGDWYDRLPEKINEIIDYLNKQK